MTEYICTSCKTIVSSQEKTVECPECGASALLNVATRHPESAAAVRRALGLQPPYPVAEAVPYPQDERRMEWLYGKGR